MQKAEKKELAAVKVLNKATHKHDVALTHLHGAEKDAKAGTRPLFYYLSYIYLDPDEGAATRQIAERAGREEGAGG